MVRLTDRPDMTLDVYRGRKTTAQQQQLNFSLFFFYLPEQTETDLITESDQTVRAVHSCNSWFHNIFKSAMYI